MKETFKGLLAEVLQIILSFYFDQMRFMPLAILEPLASSYPALLISLTFLARD